MLKKRIGRTRAYTRRKRREHKIIPKDNSDVLTVSSSEEDLVILQEVVPTYEEYEEDAKKYGGRSLVDYSEPPYFYTEFDELVFIDSSYVNDE